MKCLMRYEWVKLLRSHLPEGKGILGMWAKLASRAAFRKGIASYCGYENEVVPGMWSGGIVGVKSILGVKSRKKAFEILDTLSKRGYIKYTLDIKTKKLTYQITDWVIRCSGEECMNRTVYIDRDANPPVMKKMPILGDLHQNLQKNKMTERIAVIVSRFVTGSAQSFNQQTNVDLSNKYIVLNLSELKGKLLPVGIQINSTMTVRQTIAIAQVIPQYRQTEGQGRRKLLTPDEVLRLPNEELLCVVHGYNILKLKKLDYTRSTMSKKIQRVSIMDYTPRHCPQTDFENTDICASAMQAADPIGEPKPVRKKKTI